MSKILKCNSAVNMTGFTKKRYDDSSFLTYDDGYYVNAAIALNMMAASIKSLTTPFSITGSCISYGNVSGNQYGLSLWKSDGTFMFFSLSATGEVKVQKWITNGIPSTVFYTSSAIYFQDNLLLNPLYQNIIDDGSNIYYRISIDGFNFYTLYSHGNINFTAPVSAGFGFQSSASPANFGCISFKVDYSS